MGEVKNENKYKGLSITGVNDEENISIIVNEEKQVINVIRQDAERISNDIYKLENTVFSKLWGGLMVLLLIVYGVFASLKWLANYMSMIAMIRYVESMGLDGPSKAEIEVYVREEVRRIFRREWGG